MLRSARLDSREVDLRLPRSIGIAILLGVAIWVGDIVALFGCPTLFIVPWPVSIRNVLLSFFLPFLGEFNYLFFISGLVLLLGALIAGWDIVREHKHSKLVEGFQRLRIVVGTVLGLAWIALHLDRRALGYRDENWRRGISHNLWVLQGAGMDCGRLFSGAK